jgi:hypothetical protein
MTHHLMTHHLMTHYLTTYYFRSLDVRSNVLKMEKNEKFQEKKKKNDRQMKNLKFWI